MSLFDWQSVQDRAAGVPARPVLLSGLTLTLLVDALAVMMDRFRWDTVDDVTWDAIDAAVSDAVADVLVETGGLPVGIGGLIIYFPGALPDGILASDGGTYLREDWPALYQYLEDNSSPLIIDADTFQTAPLTGPTVNIIGVGPVTAAYGVIAR